MWFDNITHIIFATKTHKHINTLFVTFSVLSLVKNSGEKKNIPTVK